ncbi:hypothetical protein [Dyella telluris]|uniref:Uncharacterized protein n=1 Tax=Dyella telluris TaxID=2763498 RepID=A0A7G8Q5Z2_9GAMM|nr:hypothetical protein [Dyella telluris]QNK02200.1 hypothetical protein H8F01_03265 [Dyella telluris]
MHFELPEVHAHSLKAFAKHYVMIVVSILTALSLEAWVEHVHHEHAASEARARIDAEIHQNFVEITRAREHDRERMRTLGKLRDDLLGDLKAHASAADIDKHLHDAMAGNFYLDGRWPTLRHEAWDVAVANQSAGWIDAGQLRRYSSVYAEQSAKAAIIASETTAVLSESRMADATIDIQAGDVEPRELLHITNQMVGVLSEEVNALDALARDISESFPAATVTPPANALAAEGGAAHG